MGKASNAKQRRMNDRRQEGGNPVINMTLAGLLHTVTLLSKFPSLSHVSLLSSLKALFIRVSVVFCS